MVLPEAGALAASLSSKLLSVGAAGLCSAGKAMAAAQPAVSALGPMLVSLKSSSVLMSPVAAKVAAATVGGAISVGSVPVVLGAMGFTKAGIAASSMAASMMSSAAIANGGGVASGSLVATLQSVGAAGLSFSSKILLGSAGSALGVLLPDVGGWMSSFLGDVPVPEVEQIFRDEAVPEVGQVFCDGPVPEAKQILCDGADAVAPHDGTDLKSQ